MNCFSAFIGASMLCCTLLIAGANAGETEHRVKIMTVAGDGAEPVELQFSSDHSFADLQDGESRQLTTDSGESITVNRNGDQLRIITSTGQEIDLPFLDGQQVQASHGGNKNVEKNIRVIRKHKGEPANDIMIMSPGGLSDIEKQAIRDAMTAAGITKQLHFVGDRFDGEINIEIETSD